MKVDKPTYLIAELQGDVVPLVNELRKHFNPGCSQWPVDITIAGSSGIGTIKEEQMIGDIIDLFSPVIKKHGFTKFTFTSITSFPNTGIYNLAPERDQFDILHEAVVKSDVLFNENRWPYTPHCTLRSGPSPTKECNSIFKTMSLPKNASIECFSLYQPVYGSGFRVHRF